MVCLCFGWRCGLYVGDGRFRLTGTITRSHTHSVTSSRRAGEKSAPVSTQEASLFRVIRGVSLTHARCPSSGGGEDLTHGDRRRQTRPAGQGERRPRGLRSVSDGLRHSIGERDRASNLSLHARPLNEAVIRGLSYSETAEALDKQSPCRPVTGWPAGRYSIGHASA